MPEIPHSPNAQALIDRHAMLALVYLRARISVIRFGSTETKAYIVDLARNERLSPSEAQTLLAELNLTNA